MGTFECNGMVTPRCQIACAAYQDPWGSQVDVINHLVKRVITHVVQMTCTVAEVLP